MSEKTVFLVYGYDNYECPYAPIKAFACEASARELLALIDEHHAKKPESPSDDASDAVYEAWDKEFSDWRDGHPAGKVRELTFRAHHAELEAAVRDAGYWRKLMQWHDAPKGNKYATVVFWESEPHEPENALELVKAMNRAMHNSAREG